MQDFDKLLNNALILGAAESQLKKLMEGVKGDLLFIQDESISLSMTPYETDLGTVSFTKPDVSTGDLKAFDVSISALVGAFVNGKINRTELENCISTVKPTEVAKLIQTKSLQGISTPKKDIKVSITVKAENSVKRMVESVLVNTLNSLVLTMKGE